MEEWSRQQAREMYHITHWSDGFFDIGEDGRVYAYPRGTDSKVAIDLYALAQDLCESGLNFPILIRFTDILRKRIQLLNEAFKRAINVHAYTGSYLCAYPIKVNQQRRVVEAILDN